MNRVFLASLTLAVSALVAGPMSASGAGAVASAPLAGADEPGQDPDPSFSLGISPTRLELGPGELTKTQRIAVSNGADSPMHVVVQKQNFGGSPDGSLRFDESAPYSATRWVTVTPEDFTLGPGARRSVKVRVAVPADPEPGDHQVALVFLVPAGATSGNIKINRGIATPVYITVPGATTDTTTLTGLDADGFSTGGPMDITATVHNTGNVHRNFRGADALQVSGAGDAELFADFTVMRESTRDISTTWDPPLLCICHPTVSITDEDGTVHSESVRVIVFPLPLFGAFVGGALLLWVAWWLMRRRYRASVEEAARRLPPLAAPSNA